MASAFSHITPNLKGIDAVLSSAAVETQLMALCEPIAENATAIAQEPEAEYKTYVDQAGYVKVGKVVCGNQAARRDNARHNTLLKACGW